MKSFSQFCEEASADAEARKEARKIKRKKVESEAARRLSFVKKLTQRNRKKMLAKKAELEARISQQRQDTENLRAKQRAQRERSQHVARITTHNTSQAVKGTAKLGIAAVRGVRKVIKKRRQQAQSNQNS